jgi:hypothetical protein
MCVLNFLLTLLSRWLVVARDSFTSMRAAYRSRGLRAALFELEMRAKTCCALALGSPLVFAELLATVTETENLRAAWDAGVAPETYVRRRCEAMGIAVGSPTYLAILAWSWSMVNFWRGRESV